MSIVEQSHTGCF